MTFINSHMVIYALLAIFTIAIILNRLNSRFFKWVRAYWFFERTWINRLSSFLYLASLFLLMLSLLDLRGPEKKMKANLPDQQTIIVLDSSASMLSEDVRPNRFVKSLQLARHFVKSAPGHQISVVLFSDIQKRLIPFTDDIDLIDSRLAALEKTNSVAGGSNISQAIEESIQYFDSGSENDKGKTGNLLVFTDAEESEGELSFNLPHNINLAVVGVGTAKGANIPLRWEDGSFRGYKTFKGEPVTTKLDEEYIRKMGKRAKNFKYWIANSYSLPTEEIMNFFRSLYNQKVSSGDVRVRPVYSHLILIPALIAYCLSVLLGRWPMFKSSKNIFMLIFCLVSFPALVSAQEKPPEEKPLSAELKKDLEIVRSGNADRRYVLKVAEKMLIEKKDDQAEKLYSEYAKTNDDEEIRFNHATSLLKLKRQSEALPLIQDLLKNSKNEELKDKMRGNLILSLNQQSENKNDQKQNDKQKQDQKEEPKDKDKDKEKEKNKTQEQSKNQKPGQDKKENGKNGKAEQQKENNTANKKPDDQSKDKDKDKDKDKGKNKPQSEKNEDQDKGPSTLEEKEKDIEQKRKMVKTPAMIKQLLNDDRDLQKKMMDTSTNERGEDKPKRDW